MSGAPVPRAAALRWLWSTVRGLTGGEDVVRDLARQLNDRDRTNQGARGTDDYGSTRRLDDGQFRELCDRVARVAGRDKRCPNSPPRPVGPRGGRPRRESAGGHVTYLASAGELAYVERLFGLVGWSPDAQARFIERQTKGSGLRTHRDCTAVIAPLERIAREQGHQLAERQRQKRWRRRTHAA